MNLERDFHMATGEAEANYANNSRLQRKALLKTKPLLDKAVRQVYTALQPPTMVVADLGCSVGTNTLLFVSEVISTVAYAQYQNELGRHPMELQFFLNDLPGNDFNQVFQSLQQFTKSIAEDHPKEIALSPFYISGLPGSFYTRIFPCQSVHLFHSSYCLHWQSQMIKDMDESMANLNGGNIYITKSTPPSVVKLYQDQFQKDMALFLKLRHQELMPGGKMLLTFLGRKKQDVLDGDMSHLFGLLAEALQSLVTEGVVEKGKLESFNIPMYGASIDEVKAVVALNELFDMDHIELFESNWDPYDDLEHDDMCSSPQRGVNVAKCIRAVLEPLLVSHFGEYILDELFKRYAHLMDRHLAKENTTKFSVIVLALNRRG
ncbi:anthranilate O-methyltransferase 3-like [Oryza brachyantha]|uniref:anthranilate O-methyltransferase 3-like n=1 Tax=Oryza brachyantha TaxID=4533 RepID=UPI0003EAB58A|nr:anthranilate O-methyltransferase 3-like [Oryza brachyantha]